jgi:hypothetical protein
VPQQSLVAQQGLPTAKADGVSVIQRGTRYGDSWVPMTPENMLVAEGAYYRATNPTPGTAIAQAITNAFAATTPLLVIRNTDAAGGKTLYIDYIRLLMTVIPATGTAWDILVIVDPNNRYTSGGSALAPVNCNTGFANASVSSLFFGAVTAPAAVAPRQITRARVFNVIPVVNSQLTIAFGAQDFNQVQTINGTNAVNLYVPCGPVALGPGGNHSMLLYSWYPGNATTPPSFEVEIAAWER